MKPIGSDESDPCGFGMSLGRRRFIASGLGGAACATLGGLPIAAWAQTVDPRLAGKILNLVIRYHTDAERIARVLPPGIEPDDTPEVMLDWWVRYPTLGTENIFYPAVYSECGVHVSAKYQGRRGMWMVDMPLDQEWGRTAGRENSGLLKKDGVINIARDGQVVTADLHRRGKLVYRITTEVVDKPAHPLFWHRETGFGAFLYRYRLNPDWRQGPLASDPVELWIRVLAGKLGAYPPQMTVGGPRECDPARTRLEFVDPAPLDPIAEFPLRRVVGMSYSETGMAPADEAAYRGKAPRSQTRSERLQFVDNRAFEPWAMINYDRPVTAGRAWTPPGWPARATALKLTPAEVKRYRERPSLDLRVGTIDDFQLEIDGATHARTLPQVIKAGSRPVIRILALNFHENDISTEGFRELWLLSRCEHEGAEAWYALSNIVGAGGDVLLGRETFGYPSKMGAVAWSVDGGRSIVTGSRMGREFARMSLPLGPVSVLHSVAVDELTVIGLRLNPPYRTQTLTGFVESGPQANLVSQPWRFELKTSETVDPAQCRFEFPSTPAPGRIGSTDPWFEFKDAKPISAITGGGIMRRLPGKTLAVLADYRRYYMERMDGTDISEQATAGGMKHTFLVRP